MENKFKKSKTKFKIINYLMEDKINEILFLNYFHLNSLEEMN